jgi:hypothetical protein
VNTEPLLEDIRVILYHKHRTSARTLFLRHADGGVCTPKPLPPLSSVLPEEETDSENVTFAVHPASLALVLGRHLELPPDFIEIDPEFSAKVDTPGQLLTFYIGRFKCMDPPCAQFTDRGGKFCAITDLRGQPPAEMELLRRAYQAILGG